MLLQRSTLLALVLLFPSISPILLVLLQTKSNALLLSLFAPQGDEKSLAVALCWPVLLVESFPVFSCIEHFNTCLCMYVCVSYCVFYQPLLCQVICLDSAALASHNGYPELSGALHTSTDSHTHTRPMLDYPHHR